MKDRAALRSVFRIIHAMGALGLLALAAALTLSLPARAQPMAPTNPVTPLEQAIAACTDPMTGGEEKLTLLAAYGWQEETADSVDLVALAGAHIGSILGSDAPVAQLLELRPQLEHNFATLAEQGGLELLSRDGALLGVSIYPTENGDGLGCYFAAAPGAGMEAFWEGHSDLEPMEQSGTLGTIFTGTAFNARDDIAYDEYHLYLTVAEDLTPLSESFRYERVPQP